jgi:hypothetical protein
MANPIQHSEATQFDGLSTAGKSKMPKTPTLDCLIDGEAYGTAGIALALDLLEEIERLRTRLQRFDV